jgi:hypothetical protein
MRLLIHRFTQLVEILLAMSGVVVRRMTIARAASILLSLALYLWLTHINSVTVAVWYFAGATLYCSLR